MCVHTNDKWEIIEFSTSATLVRIRVLRREGDFFFSQEAATEAAHEAAFLKALSQQADAEFQSLSTTPKSH